MNATTVLLGCLFWGLVWGYIGLFLAMPLMGGIKAICQSVPGWEPWGNLMGMEAFKQEHASFFRRLGLGWLISNHQPAPPTPPRAQPAAEPEAEVGTKS
jgi:hypothetical protein